VVDDRVARDPQQPRRHRAPPIEGLQRPEHLEEDVLRQVLGQRLVPHPEVDIAVDPVHVPLVELTQGLGIPAPRPLDQPLFGCVGTTGDVRVDHGIHRE
jgi:hypothetical protein